MLINAAEDLWCFNAGLEKLLNVYIEESQLTKVFDSIMSYLSNKTEECISEYLKKDLDYIPAIYTFAFSHNWCKTPEDSYTIKTTYTKSDTSEHRISNTADLWEYLKKREAYIELYGYTEFKETYSN